jgi:hypothetical protein
MQAEAHLQDTHTTTNGSKKDDQKERNQLGF